MKSGTVAAWLALVMVTSFLLGSAACGGAEAESGAPTAKLGKHQQASTEVIWDCGVHTVSFSRANCSSYTTQQNTDFCYALRTEVCNQATGGSCIDGATYVGYYCEFNYIYCRAHCYDYDN